MCHGESSLEIYFVNDHDVGVCICQSENAGFQILLQVQRTSGGDYIMIELQDI